MAGDRLNVRFTPKSGHGSTRSGCPLCANNGHWRLIVAGGRFVRLTG
jgi:hypothetical protein